MATPQHVSQAVVLAMPEEVHGGQPRKHVDPHVTCSQIFFKTLLSLGVRFYLYVTFFVLSHEVLSFVTWSKIFYLLSFYLTLS